MLDDSLLEDKVELKPMALPRQDPSSSQINAKCHAEVLFVDDEKDTLSGFRRMLYPQQKKWDSTFVTSVEEALEVIKNSKIDVVVSDIYMPGRSGFDLLKQLRQDDATVDLPVLILTGNAETSLKRQALELGATDLLFKPVGREDLIVRVDNMLQIKSQQDQIKEQNRLLDEKVRARTLELEMSHLDLIWRLARVAECRDQETGNHILRVAHYSRILAKNYGLDDTICEQIYLASPLHDIGKIGISDNILLKPGKLSDTERIKMNNHCLLGAELLSQNLIGESGNTFLKEVRVAPHHYRNPVLTVAAEIAMSHHERWDGTGYPQKLCGQEIPLNARICAISDVFDALSTSRPYKKAFAEETVLEIMSEEAGKQFDPELFDVFLRSLPEFRIIRSRLAD